MGWGEAKQAAERANKIKKLAERFHEAPRSEQASILSGLKEMTGSDNGAKKAIRDVGGGRALGRFFGR